MILFNLDRIIQVYAELENNDVTILSKQRSLESFTVLREGASLFRAPCELWWIITQLVLTLCQSFVIIYALVFLLAIITNKSIRSTSYNVYLTFLVLPNMMMNICASIFSMSVIFQTSTRFLLFIVFARVWVVAFFYGSSFFLSSIISYEIHKLVKNSHRRIQAQPISLRKVYIQILCAYTLSALSATWISCTVLNSSEKKGFCNSILIAIIIIIMLVPTLHVLYVRYDIWKEKLLPILGRTRVLSLFFLRIFFVSFGFYYPSIIITLIRSRTKNLIAWFIMSIILRILEMLQAFATLYIAIKKDDISIAVTSFSSKSKIRRFFKESFFFVKCDNENNHNIGDGNQENSVVDTTLNDDNQNSEAIQREEEQDNDNNINHISKWDEVDIYPRRRFSFFGEALHRLWVSFEREYNCDGRHHSLNNYINGDDDNEVSTLYMQQLNHNDNSDNDSSNSSILEEGRNCLIIASDQNIEDFHLNKKNVQHYNRIDTSISCGNSVIHDQTIAKEEQEKV